MTTFPPATWEIRHVEDFDSIRVPAPPGTRYHLQALMTGPPCGGREGQFRFLVSGREHCKISCKVSDIIADPLFDNMRIDIQLELGSQVVLALPV